MKIKSICIGSLLALASGAMLALSVKHAVDRVTNKLFSDWPDWDTRTIGFD